MQMKLIFKNNFWENNGKTDENDENMPNNSQITKGSVVAYIGVSGVSIFF